MIELRNICKTYAANHANPVEALKSVDLMIEDGDFISIMGPSGSGKSTLLHILALLDTADSGTYLYNQTDISTLSEGKKSKLRNTHIGIVLQDYGLIGELNAIVNVEIPLIIAGEKRKVARKKAEKALAEVGLADKAYTKTALLSGGEKQRIAIARAIVTGAELILADEPTGAVDKHNANEIMNIFSRINEIGKTIVVVTHNVEISKRCRRTFILADGVLTESTHGI